MSFHVLKIDAENEGVRLDVFVSAHLPDAVASREHVKKLILNGHIRVDERPVKAHHKCRVGEVVNIDIPDDFGKKQYVAPQSIALDILYEDPFLLVINKPVGMMVHPASGQYENTLVNALLAYSKELSSVGDDIRPGIVHRLDRETSGVLLVAKDNIVHARLAKQFEKHKVQKQYVALVEGVVEFDEGQVDAPLGKHLRSFGKRGVRYDEQAKEALTRYQVLKRFEATTLVALYPKTGRTHQLRVHMKHIGHPILGDDKYGNKKSFPRLALHAQSIAFGHPHTKTWMEISSPLPKEFFLK